MKPLCNPFIVCYHASKIPARGAIIECGVYDGATSVALRNAVGRGRMQYAADTFEGMPYDGTDIEKAGGFVEGYLSPESKDRTLDVLSRLGITPLVGMVEDTLPTISHEKFAFAFVDLDLEKPTRFVAEFLKPRMMKGSRIGFHDYLEREGYCLGGVAKVVQELFFGDDQWKEVMRRKQRDNRFIFFERQ